ncbi:hypothetical protein NMK90_13545 [Klebsiella pneumoniae]|uniref:hypothetical protein n=1 Tax=Klebsiella pneumoniae TaxID=573 RepID=UPI00209AFA24|nr:hypothetical protein [Klebsiella pneumoniae]MCO7435006.1 hypothetical protein [Klebsiella pneumoniae]MCO8278427.1 hypothetical protein [Klebsiella pneumoniae]MCP8956231.1 hypothetical protein [Klebsiella pneumoniae]
MLDYLTMPIQLKMMRKHLRFTYFPRPMSESAIFFAQELSVDEENMLKAREGPFAKKAGKKKTKARRKKR